MDKMSQRRTIAEFVHLLHWRGGFGATFRSDGCVKQTVLLQFVLQRAAANAEHFGSARAVARDQGQGLADE